MKTATVRELRNNYSKVLRWVSSGQEVEVTRHGKVVARVVPPAGRSGKADWTNSAARRVTENDRALTAKESAELLKEAQGRW